MSTKAERLHKRKIELLEQLKEVERQEEELKAARYLILGRVLQSLVDDGEWTKEKLKKLLDEKLKKKTERALFELDTAKSSPVKKTTRKTKAKGNKDDGVEWKES